MTKYALERVRMGYKAQMDSLDRDQSHQLQVDRLNMSDAQQRYRAALSSGNYDVAESIATEQGWDRGAELEGYRQGAAADAAASAASAAQAQQEQQTDMASALESAFEQKLQGAIDQDDPEMAMAGINDFLTALGGLGDMAGKWALNMAQRARQYKKDLQASMKAKEKAGEVGESELELGGMLTAGSSYSRLFQHAQKNGLLESPTWKAISDSYDQDRKNWQSLAMRVIGANEEAGNSDVMAGVPDFEPLGQFVSEEARMRQEQERRRAAGQTPIPTASLASGLGDATDEFVASLGIDRVPANLNPQQQEMFARASGMPTSAPPQPSAPGMGGAEARSVFPSGPQAVTAPTRRVDTQFVDTGDTTAPSVPSAGGGPSDAQLQKYVGRKINPSTGKPFQSVQEVRSYLQSVR